jgi:hypothetical protein
VINEVMASNSKTATDNKGEYDDWIELYNKSNAAIDISGWFISDDANKRKKWTFPQNTTLAAKGYLIVWADEDSSQNTATSYHTNFKLSASGEEVLLSQKDSNLVDKVTFSTLNTDESYARRPNGTGNFVRQTPTFNDNNNSGITSSEDILLENNLKIYPNPSNTEGVTVETNYDKPVTLKVFNLLGQLVYEKRFLNQTYIHAKDWQRGIYILKVGNVSKKWILN